MDSYLGSVVIGRVRVEHFKKKESTEAVCFSFPQTPALLLFGVLRWTLGSNRAAGLAVRSPGIFAERQHAFGWIIYVSWGEREKEPGWAVTAWLVWTGSSSHVHKHWLWCWYLSAAGGTSDSVCSSLVLFEVMLLFHVLFELKFSP